MDLIQFIFFVGLGLVGAVFGSFAGAQVWRLRARQLVYDKKSGQKVDRGELKKLKPLIGKLKTDRSRCLSCQHELTWYDLLPIVSWLSIGGRCRYCREPIGWTELLLELSLAAMFVLSVIFWPAPLDNMLELVKLAMWLAAIVVLAINFIYDLRWSLLVSGLNWLLIVMGLIFAGISIFQAQELMAAVWSLVGAVAILGGLYGLLWLVSRGRWVGDGDIYLGTGLALFLGKWELAFVALFVANLVGVLIILPSMLSGKLGRGSRVPFGPLLIIGGLVAWFFGQSLVDWYWSLLFFL